MMDPYAAMSEVVGYTDGIRGIKADTTVIEGEYRRSYMRGFLKGRSVAARCDDDLEPPDSVNKGGEGLGDDS
jgi:hypothetical protein